MQGNNVESIDILDSDISYFVRCEHLARYIYASEQIRKRKANRVLDVACGSGYGSVEIAKYANSVTAVDKNIPFVKYIRPNIHYIQTDLNADNFLFHIPSEKKLDAIVCFETLEHLENPKKFLLSIAQILKNNSLLFVSIPNGNFEKTDDNNNPINPYHLQHFSESEACELLNNCGFEIMRTLYQSSCAQLYRNEARAKRDLNLENSFIRKMSPDIENIHYYSRVFAWPDENKGQSYSLIFMCERKY